MSVFLKFINRVSKCKHCEYNFRQWVFWCEKFYDADFDDLDMELLLSDECVNSIPVSTNGMIKDIDIFDFRT